MRKPRPFDPLVPNETRLRLLKLQTERRQIQTDNPLKHIAEREPNFARLQMAVCRGAFIFGRDHVKTVANFKQKVVDYGPEQA